MKLLVLDVLWPRFLHSIFPSSLFIVFLFIKRVISFVRKRSLDLSLWRPRCAIIGEMFLQCFETTQIPFKCKSRHASRLAYFKGANLRDKNRNYRTRFFPPFLFIFFSSLCFLTEHTLRLLTSRLSPKLKLPGSSVEKLRIRCPVSQHS